MASAQQLIGLIKSHAEGDEARFFDLSMQLAAAEEQKGHARLAEQLRAWAEAGSSPPPSPQQPTILAAPRGDLAELIGATYPSTRLSALVLPEHTRSELAQLVVEARQRERLEERGLHPRRRILLVGPPGTGKTMSASALAGELKFPQFNVLLHGLITKYFGETASRLRMVFDAIRNTRGVYLFDEIDALAGSRTRGDDVGEARRVLNSFLQFLEEDPGPSIIVATTNLPELLDSAILRRFDLVLMYDYPDEAAILETIKRRLRGFDVSNIDWSRVIEKGLQFSPADLVRATEDAARRAVLAGEDTISTISLVESLSRRRALQQVGDTDGAAQPPASSRSRGRGRSKLPTRGKGASPQT